MCNGAPRTSRLKFGCIDEAAGQADYYTRVKQIYSYATNDSCTYEFEVLIPEACDGPRYGLCADSLFSPNPIPTPSPQFVYQNAFISTSGVGGWSDVLVTAYVMGSVPPDSVRLVASVSASSATHFKQLVQINIPGIIIFCG